MGRATLLLPLALLFLASVISSKAQKTEAAGEESRVTVAVGAPLTVECRLRPEQRAEWRRDGAALPADMRAAAEAAAGAGLAARLQAPAARAQHAGLYTCSREREHRVRVVVLPARAAETSAAVSPAAPASPAAPPAPPSAPADDSELPELLYDVRGNLSLHCALPNENGLAYVWNKNGTSLEQVWEMNGRYTLERGGAELRLARALEDDFGNYSCALVGRDQRQAWAVRGRPHLKLPANTNVVEGQRLKLVCKVIGKPYRPVTWWYSDASDGDGNNYTEVTAALGARALLTAGEGGAPGAVLTLEAAARSDAGLYRCSAPDAAAPALTTLRVKDMYAALWPFLGICAEVFVLCAIILVYEKRRTKPELDDSDTDNHDQKKS